MPRIAATLGVFGLVVLALGLNMAQFPIEYGSTVPMVGLPGPEASPETAPSRSEVEVVQPESANADSAPARGEQKPAKPIAKQPEKSPPTAVTAYPSPTANLASREETGDLDPGGEVDLSSLVTQSDLSKDTQNESEEQADEHRLDQREFSQDSYAASEPESEVAESKVAESEVAESEAAESEAEVVPEYTRALSDNARQPTPAFSAASPAGIYNPLEPRRDVVSEFPSAAAPIDAGTEPDLDVPTEATPNPAYAADPTGDPAIDRTSQGLVPIETDPTEMQSRNGVIRLPSIDGAPPIDSTPTANDTPSSSHHLSSDSTWPSEAATQSLPVEWFPSEGYKKPEGSQ